MTGFYLKSWFIFFRECWGINLRSFYGCNFIKGTNFALGARRYFFMPYYRKGYRKAHIGIMFIYASVIAKERVIAIAWVPIIYV